MDGDESKIIWHNCTVSCYIVTWISLLSFSPSSVLIFMWQNGFAYATVQAIHGVLVHSIAVMTWFWIGTLGADMIIRLIIAMSPTVTVMGELFEWIRWLHIGIAIGSTLLSIVDLVSSVIVEWISKVWLLYPSCCWLYWFWLPRVGYPPWGGL